MRSEIVSDAVRQVSNRYLLASLASRAARALHRPHSRVEDTLNDVIEMLGRKGAKPYPSPATPLARASISDIQ
jgi:hypothetical protein